VTIASARRDARPDKQPASPAAGAYGHPIHPILVTVPIGAWISSLVFDIASHIVSSGAAGYHDGAELLITIGIIGAVVAALWGLLDYRRIERGTTAASVASTHLAINAAVIVLFVVSWIVRQGSHEQATSIGLIVLSIVALALLSVSGWLGGKLSYRYGVRVSDEATQAEGFGSRHHSR
jgi:uncharacterized membrane protein